MQLEVVPQDLDQHVFTVLRHPVTRNLMRERGGAESVDLFTVKTDLLHLTQTTSWTLHRLFFKLIDRDLFFFNHKSKYITVI